MIRKFNRGLRVLTGVIAFLATAHASGFTVAVEQEKRVKIAVLASQSTGPYSEMLEGFKEGISSSLPQPHLLVHHIDSRPHLTDQFLRQVRELPADLLFAIGTNAAQLAIHCPPEIMLITGLIVNSDEIGTRPNSTSVALEFPFEVQFRSLRKILPDCRQIGVIHSPDNSLRVKQAASAAAELGLTLHARQVNSPSEIPDALTYLSNRIDALLGMPDGLVFTNETIKHILLYSFRNRIPLIGLSRNWVKAGALYSLDWDFRDLGLQCAEMALRMLAPGIPGHVPAAGPRKATYFLNLRTAEHMKVHISESVIHNAVQVYR